MIAFLVHLFLYHTQPCFSVEIIDDCNAERCQNFLSVPAKHKYRLNQQDCQAHQLVFVKDFRIQSKNQSPFSVKIPT